MIDPFESARAVAAYPEIAYPMIEYPEHISELSQAYYDGKISVEVYRQERRRIIDRMDQDCNGVAPGQIEFMVD